MSAGIERDGKRDTSDVELREQLDLLRTAGFAKLVDVLLTEDRIFTRTRRLNISAISRITGYNATQVKSMLAECRTILEEAGCEP